MPGLQFFSHNCAATINNLGILFFFYIRRWNVNYMVFDNKCFYLLSHYNLLFSMLSFRSCLYRFKYMYYFILWISFVKRYIILYYKLLFRNPWCIKERDQFNKAGSIRPHMESIERMMADASHLHKAVNRVKKVEIKVIEK